MLLASALPPGLLHEIFSLSVPKTPSRTRLEYLVRQASLRRFALVHRQWTLPAQQLLNSEVWIQVITHDPKEGESRKLSRDEPSTKHLRIEGPLQNLVEMRHLGRFEQVLTIRHQSGKKSKSWHQIALYAEFRYLEALHLDRGKYKTESCKPEISFHKLERLTLGKIHVSNWPQTNIPQHVFNPTCMPKLRHLALHHVDYFELVSAVLPQITTLAIFDSHSTRNLTFLSLSDALPLLVNLKHLSLANYNEAISQLFGSAQGNQLESLHLGIHTLEHHLEVASMLVGMVEQQRKEQNKGRILIYGWNPSLVEKLRSTTQLGLLEWREKEDSAPFEYFDGH